MIKAQINLLCVISLALGGCADSVWKLDRHERSARQIYTNGSGLNGGGKSLLLFRNNHWEQWDYSDIEAGKTASGTYQWMGERLLLKSRNEARMLTVRRLNGNVDLTEEIGQNDLKMAVRVFRLQSKPPG